MNSFRFVERGIHAEIARQVALLEAGEPGRAGDAALRPADRARSRRCAPRRRRTTTATSPSPTSSRSRSPPEMLDARARRDARAARRARRALASELGRQRRQAPGCSPSAELVGFFEAALEAGDGRPVAALANWLCNDRRRVREDPRSKSRRPRWPSWSRWPADRTSPRHRAPCSTRSSPTAATRQRSSRPRASARCGGDDELGPIVEAALAANPTPPRRSAPAT